MTIPTPPDAYWANVPWWAWLCFLLIALIVSVVIGPWCIQWTRGRPSAMVSRERAIADQEAVVRRAREDALLDARNGEKAAREREEAAHAMVAEQRIRHRAEIEALQANRDEGWDLGRGMEDVAHQYFHLYNGLSQRFAALVTLIRGVLSGSIMPERAQALVDEIPPVAPLPEVPKLRDVKRKRPE